MALLVLGARAAYTHHKRSKNQSPFPTASSASPPTYTQSTTLSPDTSVDNEDHTYENGDFSTTINDLKIDDTTITTGGLSDTPTKHTPRAVFPQFVTQSPTTIVMKEKIRSLPSGAFYVQNADTGEDLLRVTAESLSLSHRKNVYDMSGNHLFTIRKDAITVPRTYYAEDPTTHAKIFEVEGKWFIGKSRAECHFTNVFDGQPASLFMQGSWFNKHVAITDTETGAETAAIEREVANARQVLGRRQTYRVGVPEGTDLALIVAMCICLDERRDSRISGDGI